MTGNGLLINLIINYPLFSDVPLPMVCIMVEGGMRSLEIAISTLRKGTGKAGFAVLFSLKLDF